MPVFPLYVPPGLPGASVCNDSVAAGAPGVSAGAGATAGVKPTSAAGGKPAPVKPAAPKQVAGKKVSGKGGFVSPLSSAPGGAAAPATPSQKSVQIPGATIKAAATSQRSTPVSGTTYNLTCLGKACTLKDSAQNNKVVARFAPPPAGRGVTFRLRVPASTGKPAPAALYDFGDAPAGFPTLRSENGPRHALSRRVWFGALIDGESDGLRTNRDDVVGVDDEDGMIQSNPQFILRVSTGASAARTVYINAWEDWNANNRWDINANGAPGDEWIVRNQRVQVRPNGRYDVPLVQPRTGPNGRPLPAAWSKPAYWVRFTMTETPIPNGNPALGQKPSGETEDYNGELVRIPETPIDTGGLTPPSQGGSCGANFDCPTGQFCQVVNNIGSCVPTPIGATGNGEA